MNTILVRNDQMYPYSTLRPIPKGQVQFSTIVFMFSEEWYERRKIAQFEQGEKSINVPLENDKCFVPSELDLGAFTVYVRGYDSEGASIATANGVSLEIVQGSKEGGTPPVPPEPDLYQKLIEEYRKTNSRPPLLGDGGNWWIWDGVAYIDSGIPADPGFSEALKELNTTIEGLDSSLGDIDKALSSITDLQESYMSIEQLDAIIAEQEKYIGGDAV